MLARTSKGSAAAAQANDGRFLLREVYSHPDPLVDVVFIHGLNGHPVESWSSKGAQPVFWPKDLLPQNTKNERLRILTHGYDADVSSFMGGASRDKIHNHAENLVARLYANRSFKDATRRPIIFVCHSLGGLIVKRALIYSQGLMNPKVNHLRSIFLSTYGVLFLGTPHNGSDVAKWGSMLQAISAAVLPKKFFDSSPQLIEALKTQSETLQNINRLFAETVISSLRVYFFHEAKPTDFKGTREFIVDEDSAAPTMEGVERMGIEADHSHMCKFESEMSPGYMEVAEGIKRYAKEAPPVISYRWTREDDRMQQRRRDEAEEILAGSIDSHLGLEKNYRTAPGTSVNSPNHSNISLAPLAVSEILAPTKPFTIASIEPLPAPEHQDPFFVVPPGFQRNLLFVGMKHELEELKKRLFDKKRRATGTSCVLLHGIAGGGKTHLARQYIYTQRKKFPGGVFWIRAKSSEDIWRDFWTVAQRSALQDDDAPEAWRRHFAEDNTSYVEKIRQWFEGRHEWLLVFDGVSIESEQDAVRFRDFLPDSTDSSLILISRAANLVGRARLLSPVAIKVHKLSKEEGVSLLLKESEKYEWSPAEYNHALSLVKMVDCLPLAIHAMGRHLVASHLPLLKYHPKAHSSDILSYRINSCYQEILDDLERLRKVEARNLIFVLAFFGQHIPVEMIQLGLKAMKTVHVDFKSYSNGGRADINNTLSTLMSFALIERNDPDDKLEGSHDSIVDTIDMLRVHSVVQAFLCDSMKASGGLSRWLSLAVRMFCASFEGADRRIKEKEGAGKGSDYREYEVHGERLMNHIRANERKFPGLDEARFDLEKTLELIRQESSSREPGESQQDLVSIFDRTSSTSSTTGTGPESLHHHHSEASVSIYGIENDRPPSESPTTMEASLASLSGRPRYLFPEYKEEDAGYLSEEDFLAPRMENNLSGQTVRPHNGRPTVLDDDWPEIPHKKPQRDKDGFLRPHRSLTALKGRKGRNSGTWFHPEPLEAWVDRRVATGSMSIPEGRLRGNLSGSSNATTSLTAVNTRSPPPPRGSAFINSRKPSPNREQPSYAAVLSDGLTNVMSPRGRSRPNTPGRPATSHHYSRSPSGRGRSHSRPSPLSSEVVVFSRPFNSAPLESSAVFPPPHHPPRPSGPISIGRNPAPLPVEQDVTFGSPSQAFGMGSRYHQAYYPSQMTPPSWPFEPRPYLLPRFVTGYSSQPQSANMSRDASGQSQYSLTDTAPATFSPRVDPQRDVATLTLRLQQHLNDPVIPFASSAQGTGMSTTPTMATNRAPSAWPPLPTRSEEGPTAPIAFRPDARSEPFRFGGMSPLDVEQARDRLEDRREALQQELELGLHRTGRRREHALRAAERVTQWQQHQLQTQGQPGQALGLYGFDDMAPLPIRSRGENAGEAGEYALDGGRTLPLTRGHHRHGSSSVAVAGSDESSASQGAHEHAAEIRRTRGMSSPGSFGSGRSERL